MPKKAIPAKEMRKRLTEAKTTEELEQLVGVKTQVHLWIMREGVDFEVDSSVDDPDNPVVRTMHALRRALGEPRIIAKLSPLTDNPFRRVEFPVPSEEELLRIPHWARVLFAARCAQRVLSLVAVPRDRNTSESHYSAVEQAVAFAFECAEVGGIAELPPFENVQLDTSDIPDPVVTACVCAAMSPFAHTESGSAKIAALAADYSNWAGWWYSGGATMTDAYEFAAKTNTGIWSDFGRLCDGAFFEKWPSDTHVSANFFERAAPVKRPTIFICYAKQDEQKAKELFRRLKATDAVDPWLDKYRLVLGDDWESEIRKAVNSADAFVACLRPGFDEIGFRQREIRWATAALELRPPGRAYIIPFVIEPCPLPEWCKKFHAGSYMSKPTTFRQLWAAIKKHCDLQEDAKD